MGELAFDLRAGGPVVGWPGWVGLALAGSGEGGFVGADPMVRPPLEVVHLLAQRAGGARVAEVGHAAAVRSDGGSSPVLRPGR